MAHSFHNKRKLEAVSELNVTALIDLGFALLIIFMISTPLIEKEQVMEVDLPVSGESTPDSSKDQRVEIVALEDGAYQVDGRVIAPDELELELASLADLPQSPIISLRGNANAPYQHIIRVLDLAKKYKLSRFHMVTRPDS